MTLLIVLLGVEERPRFIVDALTEAEAARLYDWLRTSPALMLLATEALRLHVALIAETDPEDAA
jgi:hypothetical protein